MNILSVTQESFKSHNHVDSFHGYFSVHAHKYTRGGGVRPCGRLRHAPVLAPPLQSIHVTSREDHHGWVLLHTLELINRDDQGSHKDPDPGEAGSR